MNPIQKDAIQDHLSDLYKNLGYYDQYGGYLLLVVLMTLAVVVLVTYFVVMSNVQPIIRDWPNQRCKPAYLPFAGWITHPEGTSASEYTLQNFNYCTQNILSSITGQALEPVTFVTDVLQKVASGLQAEIQAVRAMFDSIRTSVQAVSQELMGRLINVTVPLQQMVIGLRDLIAKIQGTMTAGLFTLLGTYYTLQSLMGAIAQFIILILIFLAMMIAMMWLVPFTWGAAIANTAIFTAIAIPMAIILAFMIDVLHVSGEYTIPTIKCFDEDMLLEMHDGTMRAISTLRPGDLLRGYNKENPEEKNEVTACIKVTTEGSVLYDLHGVLVSDSHLVQESGHTSRWIRVSEHPEARLVSTYDKPFLYCLNTRHRRIVIRGITFSDWDEVLTVSLNSVSLTRRTGLSGDLPMRVIPTLQQPRTQIALRDVSVGDTLSHGEKVYGTVDTFDSLGRRAFHLLTHSGTFHIGNHRICDYDL